MSSNLVIAAIPDENDRVWKVSSEKIPHLTVLFLGDVDKISNLEQIMLFVEHAANTTLQRFYLPVDRRGELGDDKADVLFFKKGRYDYKAIRDFRAVLLKDPNIKTAYDSATQFDGPWTPHLTLGYPETPAKKIPDDQISLYDVQFNKIAVWTGDFEGPDWLLKDYWDEMEALESVPMDVAMSDIEHHGVKGQKWGVRKVEGGGEGAHIRINEKTGRAALSTQATAAILVPALVMPVLTPAAFLSKRVRAEVKAARAVNKGVKADKKWQKELTSAKRAVEVHNKAADEVNAKVGDFNSDKRWKNADGSDIDLNKNPAKMKEYNTAVERELLNPAYANAAVAVHGSSPTGRYKFEIKDAATGLVKLTDTTKVEHAAEDELSVQFKILRDASGHIVGFNAEDDEEAMVQTIDLGAAWLAHYGVKGMRWGVRRPGAVTTQTHIDAGLFRRRTKLQTKGGEAQDAHPDAVKVAIQRQVLKKSGTAALSNQDLRDLTTRLQLEAQVQQLTTKKGQRAVQKQLEEEGKQQLAKGLRTGVKRAGPSVVKKASKKAATAATIAALV